MKPVSIRQTELLVEFMARHRDLALGRVRSKEGRALSVRLWKQLADILNSEVVDPCAYRSPKDWNKFYNDYKCRIKNKCRRIAQSQRQTGGGPSDAPPLSEVEERLCAIIGPDRFEPLPVRQESVPPDSIGNPNVLMKKSVNQFESEEGQAHQEGSFEVTDYEFVTQIDNVEEQITQEAQIEMVHDVLLDGQTAQESQIARGRDEQFDSLTTRQRKSLKTKVTAATGTENEVEKTKTILADIHRAQIEVSRSQVQAQLARNEIEQRKVEAINNLSMAAWALVSLFKPEEENKTTKCSRSSGSSSDDN